MTNEIHTEELSSNKEHFASTENNRQLPASEAQFPNLNEVRSARARFDSPAHSDTAMSYLGGLLLIDNHADKPQSAKTTDKSPAKAELDSKLDTSKPGLKGEEQFAFSQIKSINQLDASGDKMANGEISKENGKLPAGDYEVKFQNGRCFQMHIPANGGENMPIMFVIPGVEPSGYEPRDFLKGAHFNEEADRSGKKFIVVSAINSRHLVGENSTEKAFTWNMPGALIHSTDVAAHAKKVGYDDRDYFAGMFKLGPQLSGGTKDSKQWAVAAFSQGTAVVGRLACDERFKDKIHNVYLIAGSLESGDSELGFKASNGQEPYRVLPYNIGKNSGNHVLIVDTAGDSTFLPHPQQNHEMEGECRTKLINGAETIGLESVDGKHQNPEKQAQAYLHLPESLKDKVLGHPGQAEEFSAKAYCANNNDKNLKTGADFDHELKTQADVDAAHKQSKDIHWLYKNEKQGVSVEVYELPKAQHAFPGPSPAPVPTGIWLVDHAPSVGPQKYAGFDAVKVIGDDFRRISK